LNNIIFEFHVILNIQFLYSFLEKKKLLVLFSIMSSKSLHRSLSSSSENLDEENLQNVVPDLKEIQDLYDNREYVSCIKLCNYFLRQKIKYPHDILTFKVNIFY
jgi:hypothetical protein